jgi:DNA-binding transcriptional LysR family regulator
MAALEKSLGLALFTRSQTGLMPTEAAQSLRGFAEAMQSTAASLERAAAGQGAGVRGTVRLTCSDVIGVEVLPPIVTALRDQYPELSRTRA